MNLKTDFPTNVRLMLATAVLAVTIGFFAPLNLYYRNYNEYTAQFWAVFHTTGVISLGLWLSELVGILIIDLMSLLWRRLSIARLNRKITVVVAMGAAFLWLQGNILAIDYGVFNGRPVDWGQFTVPVMINSLIWLILLGLAWYQRRRLLTWVLPITFILFAMQTVNLYNEYRTQPHLASFKTHLADYTHYNDFSLTKNVVIILLDTFQSDIFEEIVTAHPSVAANFTGFTYYRNTAGGFPTTYTSVPLIMTGQYYLNQRPIQDFLQSAYLQSSLPKNLQQVGFTNAIPCNQLFYCDQQISHAYQPMQSAAWLAKTDLLAYYKPAIVRYLPSLVYMWYQEHKQSINETINRDLTLPDEKPDMFTYDQTLLQGVTVGATTGAAMPTFKYYHFSAPHPPFYMNALGQYAPQPDTRQGQINHSTGALLNAIGVINKLKALHVYDNSLVIVLADHGYGPLGYRPVVDQNHPAINTNPVIGAALPLLLIKPIGATGALTISDTSFSYATLAQDIFQYLKLHASQPTATFIPTVTEVRKFYFYTWEDNWSSSYLPDMTEYKITGNVRDPSSWKKTGIIYRAP